MKLLIPALSFLASYASAGKVLSLGDSDFESEMAGIDLTIVKFFAPWCGHCKSMAPEYEKAATILAENDPPLVVVEVDCTEQKATCSKYGVSGYPTLKVFRNGEISADYNGGRKSADFVKFLASQSGPASSEVADVAAFDAKMESPKNVFFGFFESEDADAFKTFTKVANELREGFKFAHTFNADVIAKSGQKVDSAALYRPKSMKSKFEEQVVAYEGKCTVGLFKSWVKETAPGLCPVVEPKGQGELGFPQVLCIYNVDYVRDPKGTQYWRNRVMKIAGKFENVNFGVASAEEWGGFVQQTGLSMPAKGPICVGFSDQATKFPMAEEFTMDNLEAFVTKMEAGELEAHMKSEGEVDNTGKANLKLTARNYKSHVDGTKDTFIKFYAPWCGHCKSLAPKWEEMAEEFADDDSMIIADFDVDSNDLPAGFEVKGFPTMFWIPANGKPKKYEGGRETADLIKHVKATHKVVKEEL
jgi:protein disulfide isomerase family A protein 3